MKGNFSRNYYDCFSRFYDGFVALHSRDRGGSVRDQLAARVGLKKGDAVLDICTGTGSLLLSLREHVGSRGIVLGIDFSMGMLKVAKAKSEAYPNIFLLQADTAKLPLRQEMLDAVTCSHAFYELKGDTPDKCLGGVFRVLKKPGRFFMMEHDVPKKFFVRILFYIRIFSMGSRKALSILKNEKSFFQEYFVSVEKSITETGRSKIFACTKT